ncbi:MAG: hypothetical protein IPP71_16495 [Bacteroidetes bacterium]|nr:hypothetical protein [Bacteroidota bacterium]
MLFVDFLVNKNFIATVLCENKSVPQKHCEGKCHLKKMLDKDSKQKDENSQKSKSISEVFFWRGETFYLNFALSYLGDISFQYHRNESQKFPLSVFRPPSC